MTGTLLSTRLDSILGTLETVIKSSTQFAIEQAPGVVHELIVYKTISDALNIFLSITIIFSTLILARKLWQKFQETNEDDFMIGTMLCIIPFAFFSLYAAANLSELIQIVFAPRIYLLEYASSLIK